MSAPTLMTVREAAGFLGRSQAFVRSLCHSRAVDSVQVNGRFYIYRAALLAWLEGPVMPDPKKYAAPYIMPME